MKRAHLIIFISLFSILPFYVKGQYDLNEKAITYFNKFNELDNELYMQDINNSQAEDFLLDNIPLFDCPDKQLEQTYYFRWWTYRKHIKQTPAGYVITEFLPDVNWSGKYNTINCAAGHHFYEGRWLHDFQELARRFGINEKRWDKVCPMTLQN